MANAPLPSLNSAPRCAAVVKGLALAGLAATLMASCESTPPAPMSADEAALKAEEKAQEHRVFYEGWLHPSQN